MARVIRLTAPNSMRLAEMSKDEISRQVSVLADRALRLAGDNKVVGVSAVSLGQVAKMGTVELWAQWTRSCCGSRQRIEDYADPTPEDYGIAEGVLPQSIAKTHVESSMHIVELQGKDHVPG